MHITKWIIFKNSNEKKKLKSIVDGDVLDTMKIKQVTDAFDVTIVEAKEIIEVFTKKKTNE